MFHSLIKRREWDLVSNEEYTKVNTPQKNSPRKRFTAELNGGASLRRRVKQSFLSAGREWSNDGVGDKSPRRVGWET